MALTRRVANQLLIQSTQSGPARQRITRTSPSTLGFQQSSDIDIGGAITGAFGGFIEGGVGGAIEGGITGAFGGGNNQAGRPGDQLPDGFIPRSGGTGFRNDPRGLVAGCPPGTFNLPGTNQCVDVIPGGETQGGGMFIPGSVDTNGGVGVGQVVQGRYGPANRPTQVGTINGQPVRRCVAGQVLGRDNLCYESKVLTRKERKWPKAPKPPITVSDAKAITRAESAKGRVKALAGKVGFSCKKR